MNDSMCFHFSFVADLLTSRCINWQLAVSSGNHLFSCFLSKHTILDILLHPGKTFPSTICGYGKSKVAAL